MSKQPYYITTPLYYVNDELHIGHTTTTIYADTLARFKRMDGYDVTLLTGSDEHGQKIFEAAKNQGKTPRELADSIVGKFKEVWQAIGISEHQFVRTTEPYHELVVKSLFAELKERGFIYKGIYRALYCKECETAYSQSALIDGRCPIHKTVPEQVDEENYFFKLSACHELLRTRLADDRDDFTPDPTLEPDTDSILPIQRRNEALGKVREGLEDVSISRTTFDWGVSMPGDPEHVIWVWFDALIGYMSSQIRPDVDALGDELPKLADLAEAPDFRKNWPHVVHLVGKDILWHHSVVWWSMLHQAGLPIPHRVYAHGWWSVEGDKMSKTLGNVIRPIETVEKYGRDALRYFILREGPNKGDADWRHERFIQANNNELANELGNLLSRSLGMLGKYHNGVVPQAQVDVPGTDKLRRLADELPTKLREHLTAFEFGRALDALWDLIRVCNAYVDETRPFKMAKDESKSGELATVMHALLQSLRVLSFALDPILPEAAARMREQLAVDLNMLPEEDRLEAACTWSDDFVGTQTTKGDALFSKIEEEAADA